MAFDGAAAFALFFVGVLTFLWWYCVALLMVVFLCFCCGIGGSFVMVLIWANLNNSYLVYLGAQLTSASLSPRLVKSHFKLTTSPPGNSSLCSVAVLKVLHASLDPLWW